MINMFFCVCFCAVMFWLFHFPAVTLRSGFLAPLLHALLLETLETGQGGSTCYLWAEPAVFVVGVSLSMGSNVCKKAWVEGKQGKQGVVQ